MYIMCYVDHFNGCDAFEFNAIKSIVIVKEKTNLNKNILSLVMNNTFEL